MNISKSKTRKINVRFGMNNEFRKNSSAFLSLRKDYNDEIVVSRGTRTDVLLGHMLHEYGHALTIFGKFGIFKNRKNFIGETSAYNFEKQIIKN